MNINLHNYETYFLMYIDNELNSAEVATLEAFVAQYPHLEEELMLLQNTAQDIPHLPMPNKQALIKPLIWQADALEDWQQQLLTYADGELNQEETIALQTKMANNPILQKEWTVLQHTQLATPTISMPSKTNLYSHAMQQKPKAAVINFGLIKKLAAAAAIVGAAFIFWPNNSTIPEQTMAVTTMPNSTNNNTNTTNTTTSTNTNNVDVPTKQATNTPSNNLAVQASNSITNAPSTTTTTNTKIENKIPQRPEQDLVQYAVVTQDIPPTTATATQPKVSFVDVPAITPLENTTIASTSTAPIMAQNTNIAALNNNSKNTDAAAKDIFDFGSQSEEDYVYIAGAKIRKTKIRGVIRTVSRNLSRRLEPEAIVEQIMSK